MIILKEHYYCIRLVGYGRRERKEKTEYPTLWEATKAAEELRKKMHARAFVRTEIEDRSRVTVDDIRAEKAVERGVERFFNNFRWR